MRRIFRWLGAVLGAVLVRDSNRNVFLAVLTLLLSNVVLNAFVLRRLIGPGILPYVSYVYAYHGVTIVVAFLLLLLKGMDRLPSLRVFHLLGLWLFLEVAVRVALFSPSLHVPFLENPSLYYWPNQTDYWVAHHLYYRPRKLAEKYHHPRYGWVLGPDNPLQIVSDRYRSIDDLTKRPILFFGDSFVAGTVERNEERIPQRVDELLPDHNVLNFGVFGYGVDQVLLRFRGEYPKYRELRPKVLIGFYILDLWRSMIEYRQLQKPYFTLEDDDRLELHVPRYATDEEYIRNYSFASTSFVATFLRKLFLTAVRRDVLCGPDCEELNRRILAEALEFIRREQIDVTFVLFYMPNETLQELPEEIIFKRIFASLGIQNLIDTKTVIRDYIRDRGIEPDELWVSPRDSHYNAEGNRILAEYITEQLRERYLTVER